LTAATGLGRVRLARAALSRLSEPGDFRFTSLTTELGPVEFHDLLATQRDVNGVLADVAVRLKTTDPAQELERAASLGIRFVIPEDAEWPGQLDDLAMAGTLHERGGVPIGLWVRGPLRIDRLGDSVAVVGSRSATTYGTSAAGEIGAVAARAGVAVISGAAYGIDQAAHRGAIAMDGLTVAVMACGADRVYPTGHTQLVEHIAATGAVVSEAPLGCSPQRVRFLARNRLIAALTRGTVVVEAAVRSGALNTANWADRLSRQVMGVPGPVTSAASGGVHQLIRKSGAALVTSGRDVLELVGAAGEHLTDEPRGPVTARDELPLKQQQVLDAVPVATGAPVDSIARVAGLSLLEVGGALRRLHAAGFVEQAAGGWRLAALARI
jgi:DNA processing protein